MNSEEIAKEIRSKIPKSGSVRLAIDGPAASGKSSVAALLSKESDVAVISADDFFIPKKDRGLPPFPEDTNLDGKRFLSEVLLPARSKKSFSYRPFDCKSQQFLPPVSVSPKRILIFEGSYLLHPAFTFAYDIQVLLSVSKEEQRMRILKRNKEQSGLFFEKWIPMEERYFQKYSLEKRENVLCFLSDF